MLVFKDIVAWKVLSTLILGYHMFKEKEETDWGINCRRKATHCR